MSLHQGFKSISQGFKSISQGFKSTFAPRSINDLYDEYDKMMPTMPDKTDIKNPFGIKIPLDKKDTR